MKFLDLFAGIGGFRLGLEAADHECVGYVEWDKYARKSYESIHDTKGEWTAHDITTVTDNDLRFLRGEGIDIICGGFPCQSFSVAGKRGGFNDTRGTMFFEIARFAKQIKPRLLLLENVKGLLSHDKGNTFGTILNTLDELGYDCEWKVLNSKNFGVPQNRERVFLIGHLRGFGRREVFSERAPGNTSSEMQGSKNVKVYDFYNKTIKYDIANTVTEHASRTDRSATNVVEYDRENGIRHGVLIDRGVLRPTTDNISTCVPATYYKGLDNHGARTGIKDGCRIRRLTPKECWRLQSFPDWAFDKAKEVNSDSQLYKQAGNSVTVNVIYEIAKRLS